LYGGNGGDAADSGGWTYNTSVGGTGGGAGGSAGLAWQSSHHYKSGGQGGGGAGGDDDAAGGGTPNAGTRGATNPSNVSDDNTGMDTTTRNTPYMVFGIPAKAGSSGGTGEDGYDGFVIIDKLPTVPVASFSCGLVTGSVASITDCGAITGAVSETIDCDNI
jgi:hypothetical protein